VKVLNCVKCYTIRRSKEDPATSVVMKRDMVSGDVLRISSSDRERRRKFGIINQVDKEE
jgi:hypothetical protein